MAVFVSLAPFGSKRQSKLHRFLSPCSKIGCRKHGSACVSRWCLSVHFNSLVGFGSVLRITSNASENKKIPTCAGRFFAHCEYKWCRENAHCKEENTPVRKHPNVMGRTWKHSSAKHWFKSHMRQGQRNTPSSTSATYRAKALASHMQEFDFVGKNASKRIENQQRKETAKSVKRQSKKNWTLESDKPEWISERRLVLTKPKTESNWQKKWNRETNWTAHTFLPSVEHFSFEHSGHTATSSSRWLKVKASRVIPVTRYLSRGTTTTTHTCLCLGRLGD